MLIYDGLKAEQQRNANLFMTFCKHMEAQSKVELPPQVTNSKGTIIKYGLTTIIPFQNITSQQQVNEILYELGT
ncbi:MAG: hypothetical protein FWE31_02870 [Firmicutes bacterium]|nr:hypothetical protein [Bacillota bacterium]